MLNFRVIATSYIHAFFTVLSCYQNIKGLSYHLMSRRGCRKHVLSHLAVHHAGFISMWCFISLHLLPGYMGEFFGELSPARGYLHCSGQQYEVHNETGHQTLTVHFQQGLEETNICLISVKTTKQRWHVTSHLENWMQTSWELNACVFKFVSVVLNYDACCAASDICCDSALWPGLKCS